ncbi:MAG TPA: hypothetical protein VEI97_01570 [bacterium]|nr:hypothetical protein [bacterium]
MALCTLAEVKAFLNVTVTTHDTWLTALKGAAEANIKDFTGQDLEYSAARVEYHSGPGTNFLVLREKPVWSIASVYLDHGGYFGTASGAFASATLLTSGVDYALDLDSAIGGTAVSKSGVLWRIRTVWPQVGRSFMPNRLSPDVGPAVGNIKVTYAAGLQTIPEDLKYAVAVLVAYYRKNAPFGGASLKFEEIGDYTYELFGVQKGSLPDIGSLRELLSKYKDPALGGLW